jgi:hypothetical protein
VVLSHHAGVLPRSVCGLDVYLAQELRAGAQLAHERPSGSGDDGRVVQWRWAARSWHPPAVDLFVLSRSRFEIRSLDLDLYIRLSAVCDGRAFFMIDAGNAASFSFLRLFRENRKPPCNWGQVAVAVGGTQLLLGTQQVPAGRLAGYRWRGRPIDLVVI